MGARNTSVGSSFTGIPYPMDHLAGVADAIAAQVADFDVDPSADSVIELDGTSAVVGATLPDPSTVPLGRRYVFVATNVDNAVTVESADLINGNASVALTAVGMCLIVWLSADGTTWWGFTSTISLTDGSVTPVISEHERILAADTNGTVVSTDRYIVLETTGAGSRTLTFGDTAVKGHRVTVRVKAIVTGTYATVGIDSGEVAFNRAGQVATFVYDETNDNWTLESANWLEPLQLSERVVAADTNGTVGFADSVIYISTTGAGSRTLTFPDTARHGHRVLVAMTAQSTGTYATVGVDSGEVTFKYANQVAEFVYNEVADTWTQVKPVAGSVDPEALQGNVRAIADDTNGTVAETDEVIELVTTSGGAGNTLTFPALTRNAIVHVYMTARDTNDYVTVGIDDGEVTFAAAEDAATFYYNVASDKWRTLNLKGASQA
jgi:hypothetical protein